MSKQVYPVGYRVLVKPDSLEEYSEGGIQLVYQDERASEAATTKGTVVAIGREAFGQHKGDDPWVEKGDYVYFSKYSGKRVEDPQDKDLLLIMNDEDILGVIRDV